MVNIRSKIYSYFTKGNERSVIIKKKYRSFISLEMCQYFDFIAGCSFDH